MNSMPIGEVKVLPNRQRTAVDPQKLMELERSIREEGLFHAIIIDDKNHLVAGHTRLTAITALAEQGETYLYDSEEVPLGEIPYTITHKTDPLSLFKIELEENLRREQLSPVDEAQALANLHRLKQDTAPEILPGFRETVEYKDTAKDILEAKGEPETPAAIDREATHVSDSILVDAWKEHPDVKRAKSFKEAVRAAKKAAERQFREVLGGMAAEELDDSPHIVINESCETALKNFVLPNSVDVIIADPPYGVGADKFGDQSYGHEYKDDEDAFVEVFDALLTNCSQVCKPDAAMFMFLDILLWKRSQWNLQALEQDGWYLWPTPLFWHKPNRGHAPQPKRGPSRRYETILYFVRGNREVRKVGSDVLTFNAPDNKVHGAQKPVDLYQELLSWHCYPGDLVLDPCAGSGPIIDAANALDLRAIAIEKDPAFATICSEKASGKGA